MKKMNWKAKAYIAVIAMLGAFTLFYGGVHWQSQDLIRLLCYVAIAVTASSLKVSLPGITGTMSVNFLFILLGIAELSLSETLAVGCSAILVQCIWNARMRPLWLQISFNVSSVAIAIFLSYLPAHYIARSCKMFLPKAIREHSHVRSPRRIFLGTEKPAQYRRNAKN